MSIFNSILTCTLNKISRKAFQDELRSIFDFAAVGPSHTMLKIGNCPKILYFDSIFRNQEFFFNNLIFGPNIYFLEHCVLSFENSRHFENSIF